MQKKKNRRIFAVITLLLAVAIIGFAGIRSLVNRYYPLHHLDIILKYADEFDLEPELISAVIHAESRFRMNAVSRAGASGLMQIMEDTAYWIAPSAGLNDFDYEHILEPEINIRLGSYYLSMLISRFGDLDVALCAYNAGSGNVNNWLRNPEYSSDGETLEHIPFPETREYVKRVRDNKGIYALLLRFSRVLY